MSMARLLRLFRRLARDRRGNTLVEFVMLAPIMTTMMIGTTEVANFILASGKLVAASETMADLVSQASTVANSDIDDVFAAGKLVMQPLAPTSFGLAVASVRFDATTGAASVDWQNTRGGAAALSTSTLTSLVTGLGGAGESVIVVRATYTYVPRLSMVLHGTFAFQETSTARPRLRSFVPHT